MVLRQSARQVHSTCSRVRRFVPAYSRAEFSLPQSVNEPFNEAIVERIRDITSRQSLDSLDAVAATLLIGAAEFRTLINEQDELIDARFLIDVVCAFVHEFAVDPDWLLTGDYNAATHREALTLSEDRTPAGAHLLHQFVLERYEKLSSARSYPRPALSKSIT